MLQGQDIGKQIALLYRTGGIMAIVRSTRRAQNTHSVGQTYGERRNSTHSSDSASQKTDSYKQTQCNDRKHRDLIAKREARKGLSRFSRTPHKPKSLDGIEHGMAGKARAKSAGNAPSDNALLGFLDKVASTKSLSNPDTIAKAKLKQRQKSRA